MVREVVVVGAGIVGSSLARELAARPGIHVTVLERGTAELRGSTANAPSGFVGIYNEAPVLTELAKASTAVYDSAGEGFTRSGGLELATSAAGAEEIERRAADARTQGLPATSLAASALPDFVDAAQVVAAVHYPLDGAAEPLTLTAALRAQVSASGAQFVYNETVTGIERRGATVMVTTSSGRQFVADDVVLAGGVWGPSMSAMVELDLPLTPVSHPYVYGPTDARLQSGPFVRWPQDHVYARVHGDRLGIGSYDHHPVPVDQGALAGGASLAWTADFDPVIASAQELLRPDVRFQPEQTLNGVFAVTPDNLPFLGHHPTLSGVWVAQAIWITHAVGAASTLTNALVDGADLPAELAVDRFAGRSADELRTAALRLYRDIYANESV